MTTQPAQYVLDASALIAFLTAEEGGILVARLISQARKGEAELHLATINLFEVYYDHLKRGASQEEANEFLDALYSLPLSIAGRIDRSWLEKAATLKVTYKVSVADSFGLALAQQLQAPLVSADHHEFDAVEATGAVQFYWIR
ncbi:MAG: PIN domain-containing protein [Anaerolineae bacterium]|jgi:predicted nucleic acid-binding protein